MANCVAKDKAEQTDTRHDLTYVAKDKMEQSDTWHNSTYVAKDKWRTLTSGMI